MRLVILIFICVLAASGQTWGSKFTNSPTIKPQAGLATSLGCIIVTEADNSVNPGVGGVWISDQCGTSLTTSTTFTALYTGSAIGDCAITADGNLVCMRRSSTGEAGLQFLKWSGISGSASSVGTAGAYRHLVADPSNKNILYANPIAGNTAVQTSTDGGANWTAITTTGYFGSGNADGMVVNPINGHLIVDHETASFGSYEWNGSAWNQIIHDGVLGPASANTFCMFGLPSGSTNTDCTWLGSQLGPYYADLTGFVPGTPVAPTALTPITAASFRFKWARCVHTADATECTHATGATGNTWYVTGRNNTTGNGPYVRKTTNNGSTWSDASTGLPTPASTLDGIVLIYDQVAGNMYLAVSGATSGGLYQASVATPPSAGGSAMSGNAAMGGNAVMR